MPHDPVGSGTCSQALAVEMEALEGSSLVFRGVAPLTTAGAGMEVLAQGTAQVRIAA